MPEILELTEDLEIIQKLGDNPNIDNGLSADELKAMFDKAPLIIKKYINEVIVPAVKKSMLADGTTPMTGDLLMDGFKVTGLGEPVDDGDAVNLGYANGNFAPAGYGLGSQYGRAVAFADLGTATRFGLWSLWDGGTLCNVTFSFAKMLVLPLDGDSITQILYPHGMNTVLTRSSVGGVWGEWECVNPPMVAGVEYRTTERYNNAVVYTMLVNCGAWADEKAVSVNVGQTIKVFDSFGEVDRYTLPFIYKGDISNAITCLYNVQPQAGIGALITLYGGTSTLTGLSTMIQIKYTKS